MTPGGEYETEFECQQTFFEKLIFSKYEALEKRYSEDYEIGVVQDQILFEFTLKLDPFKSTNSRQYQTQFHDWVGMVGGFYQGINFLIYWTAHFFSGKLFI